MQVKIDRNLFHFGLGSISTVFGIITTLIGSILMAKYYNKKPTYYEVSRLLEKEKTRHPEGLRYDAEIDLEPPVGGRSEEMKVPKSIAWELKFRRSVLPLGLLIMGACLLIMPLFLQ